MKSLHVIEVSYTAANFGNAGGFLFSVSFSYFITWFGRDDLRFKDLLKRMNLPE